MTLARAIASGGTGGGGALVPAVFGRSVNPISTRGTDYAHLCTTCPPGFSDLAKGLLAMTGFAVYALEIQP